MIKFKPILWSFFAVFISLTALAQERPNILMLIVDDLNTWLLEDPDRYTGTVIAPNIKGLAESGMNFRRAFTACPKCSPSRTAFLSGVAPWKSGIYENAQVPEDSPILQTVPHIIKYFHDQGYYTAGGGKIPHGYDLGDAWDDWIVGHSTRDAQPLLASGIPLKGYGTVGVEKDWGIIDDPTNIGTILEADMMDTLVGTYGVDQISTYSNTNQPFFIACGMFHPHFPWHAPQRFFDKYPLEDIVPPEVNANDQDDIPAVGISYINDALDQDIKDHDDMKNAVRSYLACTSYADYQVGRILDALDASPYATNTIVVLLTDHGFHLGEKQHWSKSTLWEEAMNTLMVVRAPGVTATNQSCSRIVSLLDIYPTLVELAGLPAPDHLDGRSIVPLLDNPVLGWDHPSVSSYNMEMTVRSEEYRYIRYTDGSEELYDRTVDPHEWVNQANAPAYATIKGELNSLLPAPSEMAPPRYDEDKWGPAKILTVNLDVEPSGPGDYLLLSPISIDGKGRIEIPYGSTSFSLTAEYEKDRVVTVTPVHYDASSWQGGFQVEGDTVFVKMDADQTLSGDLNHEPISLEAEGAAFTNGTIQSDASANGGDYVSGEEGFVVSWSVEAFAGPADLVFGVKAASSRSMGVFVNNAKVGVLTCSNASWEEKILTADLVVGTNMIELRDSENSLEFDVDYLKIFQEPPNWSPTVSFLQPASDMTGVPLGSIVYVEAIASDLDGTIAQVVLFQESMKVGEKTSEPYVWTIVSLEEGTHPFILVATDNEGAMSTSVVRTVTLEAVTQPDILEAENAAFTNGNAKSNVSASGGQYVDGNGGFVISWDYASCGSTVDLVFGVSSLVGTRSMGVYINDEKVSAFTCATNIWEEHSLSADLLAGWNTIELRDSERTAELNVDYLRVVEEVPNAEPTVSFVQPVTDLAEFPVGSPLAIEAGADDLNGTVVQVVLYQNGTEIGMDFSDPYIWTVTNLVEGTYTFSLVATDNQGATSATSSRTVTVVDPHAPAGPACLLHYDASVSASITTNAVSVVTLWANQTASGNNAAQQVGSVLYPGMELSTSGLNGLAFGTNVNSLLALDGTAQDAIFDFTGAATNNSGFCVMVAFRCNQLHEDTSIVIGNGKLVGSGFNMQYSNTGRMKFVLDGGVPKGDLSVEAGDTIVYGFNYNAEAGAYAFWDSKNNDSKTGTKAAADFSDGNAGVFQLGGMGERQLIGEIFEVKVFSEVLDATAFQMEQATMVDKWIDDASGYYEWAQDHGLVQGASVDDDGDGQNNVVEFYFAGNPTNAQARSSLPKMQFVGDSDVFELIYCQRSVLPGSTTYRIEQSERLMDPVWLPAENVVVGQGMNPENNDYLIVTNAISIIGSNQFFRVIVEP